MLRRKSRRDSERMYSRSEMVGQVRRAARMSVRYSCSTCVRCVAILGPIAARRGRRVATCRTSPQSLLARLDRNAASKWASYEYLAARVERTPAVAHCS